MLAKEKHIRSQEAGVKGEVRTPSAPTTLLLHPVSPKQRTLLNLTGKFQREIRNIKKKGKGEIKTF